jgi:hypothetical protein
MRIPYHCKWAFLYTVYPLYRNFWPVHGNDIFSIVTSRPNMSALPFIFLDGSPQSKGKNKKIVRLHVAKFRRAKLDGNAEQEECTAIAGVLTSDAHGEAKPNAG